MIFFGSVFQSQYRLLLINGKSFSLRALRRVIMDSLYRRYKLTLSLAACLCLMTPAHASHADLGQEANLPEISTLFVDSKKSINHPAMTKHSLQKPDNINGLAPTSIWQPEMQEPSLYALLMPNWPQIVMTNDELSLSINSNPLKTMQPHQLGWRMGERLSETT